MMKRKNIPQGFANSTTRPFAGTPHHNRKAAGKNQFRRARNGALACAVVAALTNAGTVQAYTAASTGNGSLIVVAWDTVTGLTLINTHSVASQLNRLPAPTPPTALACLA